jgi:hypothetical protein
MIAFYCSAYISTETLISTLCSTSPLHSSILPLINYYYYIQDKAVQKNAVLTYLMDSDMTVDLLHAF